MKAGHVAVIDIGKTNAKLALVDLADLSELAVVTRPNKVLPGPPWPHFDVEGHWAFLLEGLSRFHKMHGINAISVTTHGACAALLAADGSLAAPILDYEHTGPDEVAKDYDAIRPLFSETGSPRLAVGLNIGAQLHWQFLSDPTLKERTSQIVTYPQYWGHRLTGIGATDVTSLGCHTDLWNPSEGRFSSLAYRLGIAEKLAAPRRPSDVLGPILPEIAARTGLDLGTPVLCGIHDSNASLLPHVIGREPPFSVVSTGTWVIAMAIGGGKVAMDPEADTLVNVNALGNPVPSARFMGGREYDLVTGGEVGPDQSEDDLREVLENEVMLFPAVVPESGPFKGQTSHWRGAEPPRGSGVRSVALGFYLALVTARCLQNIGHDGPIVIEGPFATNKSYLAMLSAVTGEPIILSKSATGTSQGAAILAFSSFKSAMEQQVFPPPNALLVAKMCSYAAVWGRHIAV